ncbi:twin-arginine translocase TatA/TatE family subunit [Sansalvadorimonas verongulae]|uniref:twin-arginine translocase TatA/TatE family subunit n=1 Tax=Sansalvadorimonas verongulae TaxID=2172824 RepID=UPI0012BD54EE|nr:twin-arginine translocase TatA/TatE family subunit [Sansalvadorimonas verongulae]MTI12767.1 twin-arginine translocase TatA/TatE family subunit [Sansalvadorimonas verongulae]
MGFGGISMPQLVIVLVIVVVLFGTKRLGSMGEDLGHALKGFKKAIKDEETVIEKKADDS